MKVKLYNQKGEVVGDYNLPKEIFEKEFNSDLVHQVVLSQQSNKRQNTAKVKDRSEVRGGGKKPWRQKGTGRARHGSSRSPIWIGGGVTFGPTTEKNYKKRVPKKIKRAALFQVLSAKAKENLILVLDDLKIEKPKTKEMAKVFDSLFLKKGSGLLVLPKMQKDIILSARNIKKSQTVQAKDLNILDLLNYKFILMPKDSVEVMKETFLEKQK